MIDKSFTPLITSKDNQYVKQVKLLQNKKWREKDGLYLIEGVRLAEEALNSQVEVAYCLLSAAILQDQRCSDIVARLEQLQLPVFVVEEKVFQYCSDTENAQGILLAAKMQPQAIPAHPSLILVVDRIQDPGNLGTMLRTALPTAVDMVIVLNGTVDIYSPKVVRASMGAIFRLPVIAMSEQIALDFLRQHQMRILVTAATGENIYYEENLISPLAWVMGSEASGVSDFWLQNADAAVRLPMKKVMESLNVSIATGVLLYETLKQRS